MASTYQGAHITIAASKATSPSDGYFSISPPPQAPSHKTPIPRLSGTTHHAYARRTIPHLFSSTTAAEPNYSPDRAPRLRRCWIFQEHLLSRRILDLRTVELVWECNEASAARDEDVFPAIAGVVKNIQRNRTDRYLARVWEVSVLDDLTWLAMNSLRPRPKILLAPTWSWASVTSLVTYANYRTMLSDEYIQKIEPQAQRTVLLKAYVTSAGSYPTAEVCHGQLVLFGPVIAACLEWSTEAEGKQKCCYARNDTVHINFALDYCRGMYSWAARYIFSFYPVSQS